MGINHERVSLDADSLPTRGHRRKLEWDTQDDTLASAPVSLVGYLGRSKRVGFAYVLWHGIHIFRGRMRLSLSGDNFDSYKQNKYDDTLVL